MKTSLLRAAAAALLAAATSTYGAASTWNGTVSVNWTNAASWSPGIPNSGDDVIIADTTLSGNALTLNDANHTIGSLQFGTTGTRNAVFTINGSNTTATTTSLILTNGIISNYGAGIANGLSIKCPVTVGNDQTWTIAGTVPLTTADYGILLTLGATGVQRPLVLNGTLTKAGNGELVFIGLNVGNGNIIVNGGWLKLNAGSSSLITVGGTGTITVNNGATFMIAKNSGTLSITKAIVLNNGATFRLGGNSPVLQAVGSPITFNGNVPWIVDYASLLLDFTGIWSGSVASTITATGGTNTFYGNNSGLSGSINNSGTFKIRFGATNSASAAVAWGLNNAAAYYEIYGPATNIYLGSLSGASGILRNSNTNGQPATVTVGSLNTSTTFGGGIADNTSSLALTKIGSGTFTLTAANTFSGGTIISGGGIRLLGASSTLGSGPVTVQAGTLLSGSGTAGAVTLLNGGSAESDGGTGSPPLNVGSLACGNNSTDLTTNNINVYLGGKIANTGALSVNGTNIINILGAAPAVGVYDLITYAGGSIGGAGFAGFQLGALPYGVAANLQDSGTAVQLNVTAVTVEAGIWVGNVLGQWNLAGGLEWKGANSGNPQPYHDADIVAFNDAASSLTPNVTANVAPTTVLLTNSANTYTFSGAGGIIGSASVFKDFPGTVIFLNTNNYTGGTFITNGTIQIGNGGSSGLISGPIENNGSVVLNRSDSVTLSGNISGVGPIAQKGSGTAFVSGANTYTGLTTVNSGTLAAGSGTAFGDIAGSTVVSNGAALDFNAQALANEPIEAIGAGVGGAGAMVNNAADQLNAARFVTLAGPATFGGIGRWDIRNPNSAGDPSGGTLAFLHGNGYNLTKVGSNIVAFINVGDTGLSDISLRSGTLTFSRSTIMGDASKTITVFPGATFRMHRTAEFSANNLNKVVSMTNANLEVEAAGLTNTFLGPITMTGTNNINLPPATGLILQNSVGGASALRINSGGLLALQGACTYTLGTTLAGCILEVDGTLGTGANPLLITAPSTLMGNGTILDPVTIPSGSTLSPGDSIGNLVINNTLVLSAGCSNVFEINKDIATNDVVSGLTSVSYGGTLVMANVGSTGYAPGDNFKLFYAGSYSGSFSSIVPATPALGLIWVTNALPTSGTISVAVLPNPIPLTALSASSLVSTNIHVLFSAALDPTTAQDPSNYIYTNGSTVVSATLFGASNVVLGLDLPITNSIYTLKVKTVQDQAYVPNVVATTNVPGQAIDFLESTSILITNGSAFAFGTQSVVKVYSDGADIFGTQDHFQFVYKYITGDFDLSVQLESLRITDPAAKAGIMARDVTDPVFPLYDDRHYMVAGFSPDPTRNNNFTQYREAQGGTGIAPGAPRPGATYPTNWLRLKRIGSVMQGFSGPNGWDWTPMTSVDSSTNPAGSYPATIRVGLAATAHNAAQTTEAIFSKFGNAHERGILTGVQIGPDMVLSWQSNAIGATLQATPSLSAPITWTNVPGSTLTNVIHSPIGAASLFFRLAQ